MMTRREWLAEIDPAILVLDDCDRAILGVVHRCGQPPIVIYGFDELVEIFVDEGAEWSRIEGDHPRQERRCNQAQQLPSARQS